MSLLENAKYYVPPIIRGTELEKRMAKRYIFIRRLLSTGNVNSSK